MSTPRKRTRKPVRGNPLDPHAARKGPPPGTHPVVAALYNQMRGPEPWSVFRQKQAVDALRSASIRLTELWSDTDREHQDRLARGYPQGWPSFDEVTHALVRWSVGARAPRLVPATAAEIGALSAEQLIGYLAWVASGINDWALVAQAPALVQPWGKTCSALRAWAAAQGAAAVVRPRAGAVYESLDTGNRWKVVKELDGGTTFRVKQLTDREGHRGVFAGETVTFDVSSLLNRRVVRIR